MPWTQRQQNRLLVEKGILEKYFSGRVKWIDPTNNTKVEISLETNNGNKYCLRIYLKKVAEDSDFPNSVPDMVICSSPKPMPKWDIDCNNHTLGYRDGCLKICHYRSSKWTDRSTLYEVAMKGRIWLEAYESRLKTGKPLNVYLGEMQE